MENKDYRCHILNIGLFRYNQVELELEDIVKIFYLIRNKKFEFDNVIFETLKNNSE